jgi:RNA polymerase sigma-70 factor (ECF subfamily)
VSADEAADRIASIHRAWFGRAVGVLVRSLRDLDLAEESVQDAFATALVRWPRDGFPDEPGAWIVRTAHNRAIDVLRRRRVGAERERSAAASGERLGPPAPAELGDERLDLLFGCCHPALAEEARVTLTLRIVAGLTVEEIARAFLIAPATVAQRLVRAKRRVREAGIPLRVPPAELLPERLDSVLGTIYLLFNEGYAATAGPDPIRGELCDEAIRLARLLVRLMPDEPEARGLLGLLLATDARRAARYDGPRMVPLDEHDRARYDRAKLREAQGLVVEALRREPGPYGVQAAIAALHSSAPTADDTDWAQIVELYDVLYAMRPTPVVALNRAAAVSFADGPAEALPLLDELAGDLDAFGPFHAARADVLRRLERDDEAAAAYEAALATTTNEGEAAFLEARRALVREPNRAARRAQGR